MGTGTHAPRPECAVLQHVRHALLSGRGLRPFLQAGISAPLPGAARENARAQARLRDRARRPQPLELRRRHAMAHRPLGVARDRVLRGGSARRRADAGVLHGRHSRRGVPARMRQRLVRCPPEPQRQVCRSHGRAPQGAQARARPHRARRGRRAAQRLSPGQPVRRAAAVVARGGARLHPRLFARARRGPQRGGTALRAQGRRAVRARHGGDGRARQARRTGI